MKELKKLVSLILVIAMLGSVVGTAMATNVSKQEIKPILTTKRFELHKDINVIKIDQAIKNATPYWILLVAGKKEQKTLIRYIDNCYVTEEEKEEMKEFMKEIWKKYPVKFIKRDRITLITFDYSKIGSQNVTLTDYENAMLEKVAKAVADYLKDIVSKNMNDVGEVGILWYGSQHQDIIYISCKKWGVSDYYAGIARDAADDPDTWGQPPYYHYYNPDYGTGLAPAECDYYAEHAKADYSAGYYYWAYTELGWASHYLTDVGNPLHTGREGDQVLNPWVHDAYENYVYSNWESGYNFKSIVENNWYYYAINDPEQAAKSLASYSHQYVDTLYFKIYYNPDTFQYDPTVKSITENCLLETAKWTLGLVKYVRG